MNIEAIYRVTPTAATNIGIFLLSFLCPGFLLLNLAVPNLVVELDFLKLCVMSVAISAPTFVLPYIFSASAYKVMWGIGFEQAGKYGGPVRWYITHGVNNALSMYVVVAFFCFLTPELKSVFYVILSMSVLNVLMELITIIRFMRNPNGVYSFTETEPDSPEA